METKAELRERIAKLEREIYAKERALANVASQSLIMVREFPVIDDMGLRRFEKHLDISIEISNHSRLKWIAGDHYEPSPGTWCYYVSVWEYMLPAEQFEEFWLAPAENSWKSSSGIPSANYSYYDAKFSGARWHGGVTFYEKRGGLDGDPRGVKIGCDWAHHFDQPYLETYTYDEVKRQAIDTVTDLTAMYSFNRRCPYSGRWQPLAAMVEHEGVMYSKQGLTQRLEYAAKANSASASEAR